MLNFFRRYRPTLEELESLREHRSKGVRNIMEVSGIIFLAFVALAGGMALVPPLLALEGLRLEQERAELLLRRAKAEEAEARSRYMWMMDPEYFEQVARDRANQAKDGEKVIRRPAPGDLRRTKEAPKDKPKD
ncbi:MAG: hypothetical protein II349_06560 [Akkermansia sp.]|nr:hypothetical protein [Akkermansia sp.]